MKQQSTFSTTTGTRKWYSLCTGVLLSMALQAQMALPLNDLSAFKSPSANWQIAGNVMADMNKKNDMQKMEGTGILVNLPGEKASDIFSNFQHGDVDIELDYMMAKGSNSGIYLQSRYEVQLLDSWGVLSPKPGDNGGVYERWDDAKPKGQEGYQGYAPRQNASKAPGLWQHLKISFQAPRFDAMGTKIENAKMLRIELNGVTIHDNVEMFGNTRGAVANDEVPMAPLRIQGDHGPVAFRNIIIKNYDKPRPVLKDLKYAVYKGKYETEPNLAKLPPEAEGSLVMLTSTINKIPNNYLIKYTGTMEVKEPGEYTFNLSTPGGKGWMRINKQEVIALTGRRTAKTTLPVGDLPIEIYYSKFVDWERSGLGLTVTGPGIRTFLASDVNAMSSDVTDPILVEATKNTILRSFMDIPGGTRVVHAVNVGSARQLHYTYDLDNAAIVQAWRGNFLDATPMWHDRGDGSSRPTGAVQFFGKPVFAVEKLTDANTAWGWDTLGTSYRPKGYVTDEMDQPTFRYYIYNTMITDAIRVMDNGEGLHRELQVQNRAGDLYVRLAEGSSIETTGDGNYLINDKAYMLRMDDAATVKPIIRNAANGRKELVAPIQNKLSYSIIF